MWLAEQDSLMKVSNIIGVIRRRILVNYRIMPEAIQPLLPAKFKPKLHRGYAIGGICLIRLEQVRPRRVPAFFGTSSENAAHRIAVVWRDEAGKEQEGVYVTRRDTNSRLNRMAGGRIFPGEHHAAKFIVKDDGNRIDFEMISKDEATVIQVRGKKVAELPEKSGFKDLADASAFFEPGALGYSTTEKGDRLEALRLKTATWKVEPLQVDHVYSSFFGDKTKFPEDSVFFDCALVMRDIQHEWSSEEDLIL
jgi:hypothetical protein